MAASYNPSQFTKGARALFQMGLVEAPPNWVDRIATYVSSDSYDEDYSWMGEAPQMVEAVSGDELMTKSVSDDTYKLKNKKYWMGLSFSRDDINDDKVGGYPLKIRELAAVASWNPNKLLSSALTDGTSTTLGLHLHAGAFFRTDHPARGDQSSTVSNLLTGAGTSVANIRTDLGEGLEAFMDYVGENNEPRNVGFSRVFVMYPPALHFDMTEALTAAQISNTSNVRFGDFGFDLIPNPYLGPTSETDWYIGIQDTVVRGLVFQDREPVSLEVQDSADSDAAFTREEYRYKVRQRCRAGYGQYWKLIKIDNT